MKLPLSIATLAVCSLALAQREPLPAEPPETVKAELDLTYEVVLKDAKHGCWMRRPWFGQCVDAVDAWFQAHLK